MTLAWVEKRNGRPFEFAGFAFDYGGIITSWEGGRLERMLKRSRVAVNCGDDYPERMNGDVQLHSNDPDLRRRKCTVGFWNP